MNNKLKRYTLKLFCSSKNYIFLHFALKNTGKIKTKYLSPYKFSASST
ncbi:MAG: hypothetical protein M1168_02790 [Candidatus Marsarchaeota archaeon]|nr:hypothetical protein [Candidatus Marsarchaeota archaeon]